MKARTIAEAHTLEQIANIGPSIADDLRGLGIHRPGQLIGQNPYAPYARIQRATGQHHDPCLCDCFIAAVRFMEGGPPVPWWSYTPERKRRLAAG